MAKLGISIRIDDDKIEDLDRIAVAQKRDRTFVINEAIENYLEVNKWQVDHIRASLKQANREEYASEQEVKRALNKWR